MAQCKIPDPYCEIFEKATISWALRSALAFFVEHQPHYNWEAGVLREVIKRYAALTPDIGDALRQMIDDIVEERVAGFPDKDLPRNATACYWLSEAIFFMCEHRDQWSTTLLTKIFWTFHDRIESDIENSRRQAAVTAFQNLSKEDADCAMVH